MLGPDEKQIVSSTGGDIFYLLLYFYTSAAAVFMSELLVIFSSTNVICLWRPFLYISVRTMFEGAWHHFQGLIYCNQTINCFTINASPLPVCSRPRLMQLVTAPVAAGT